MAAGFHSGRSLRRALIACALSYSFLQAGVLHPADKLTEDEKIRLIRDLDAEYAKSRILLPRSKKPLEFNADGTYDTIKWHTMAVTGGTAARLGDKVQITKVSLEGDHIVFEIDHGIKSGDKWYNHVQMGVGGVGAPVNNAQYGQVANGTYIDLEFHKPMENLTSDDVKRMLSPILDFDQHSAVKLYSETLSPEMQKAVKDKMATVGMDRDQVLLAMGHPDHKYRETKDGVESEDWIFGTPPGKIVFVTFVNSKVIRVKQEYAGLGGAVSQSTVP